MKYQMSKCSLCSRLGYFSVKFNAVLCDAHFFETNAKEQVLAVNDWPDQQEAPKQWPIIN